MRKELRRGFSGCNAIEMDSTSLGERHCIKGEVELINILDHVREVGTMCALLSVHNSGHPD